MKALLDTNIIIYREGDRILNPSVWQLFNWLDKLKYDKYISPLTIEEITKYEDSEKSKTALAKIFSYNTLPSISTVPTNFSAKLASLTNAISRNDIIDNNLLFELSLGRTDILITEDGKLRRKAQLVGLAHKVFNIEDFIAKCIKENPKLRDYNVLAVEKKRFEEVDISASFFNSFKIDYPGFEKWYVQKSLEEAYVCYIKDMLIGFLFLKVENESEPYPDISPAFTPKKRLKIGTFKVESSGFRLGERFLKIVFDNAKRQNVDEVYVTIFDTREELVRLIKLMQRWGFVHWGTKAGKEQVFVKDMRNYDNSKDPRFNFPILKPPTNRYWLPIEPEYHALLFPDAKLKTEAEIMENIASRYSLEKIYISFTYKDVTTKPGDRILIYRKKKAEENARYKSLVSSLCVVQEIRQSFENKQEFLSYCDNRTVFTDRELNDFWETKQKNLKVIKLLFVQDFQPYVLLDRLWHFRIIEPLSGPRPFDIISLTNYNKVLELGGTTE